MDRQGIFTKAYRGLRAQGYRRSRIDEPMSQCLYNGPAGMHCTVGWAFDIPPDLEGRGILILAEQGLLPNSEVSFLRALQWAHDYSWEPKRMQGALVALARRFGLTLPPDDGQDPVLPGTSQ